MRRSIRCDRNDLVAIATISFLLGCSQPARTPDDLAVACVGVRPPQSAWSATPGPPRTDAGVRAPLPDDPVPAWALADFQPQSCGFRAVYGADVFRDKVLLLALWAGW